MEFGVALPNLGPLASPETVRRLAVEAEAMGYASLFLSDHVVLPRRLALPLQRLGGLRHRC